ncbi:MAG: hypothetical protein M0006_15430 [Magnetospirillum sp.]|nr:hypothetical protein [Magnetospirillum sp.]
MRRLHYPNCPQGWLSPAWSLLPAAVAASGMATFATWVWVPAADASQVARFFGWALVATFTTMAGVVGYAIGRGQKVAAGRYRPAVATIREDWRAWRASPKPAGAVAEIGE